MLNIKYNIVKGGYIYDKNRLKELGEAIIKRHTYLLEENREDWELGRYSINKAWEDAIKEICLLK